MSARVGGFRAYGLGLRALRGSGALWLFAICSEALLAACRYALVLAAVFAALDRVLVQGDLAGALSGRLWLPLAGSWLSLAAVGAVVRLSYLGATVLKARASLRDPAGANEPVIAAAARAFVRAVVASAWLWLIELIAELCRAVLFGVAVVMFASVVKRGEMAWALPIALAVVLALLIALLLRLFGGVYLVQAIGHAEPGALAAAWEAGRSLLARLGTYLLIIVLAAVLGVAGTMVAASLGAFAQVSPHNFLFARGLALVAAAVMAGWQAAVQVATVGALCAVDLDQHGELPQRPSPPEPAHVAAPVVEAEQVLVAQAIEPKPSS